MASKNKLLGSKSFKYPFFRETLADIFGLLLARFLGLLDKKLKPFIFLLAARKNCIRLYICLVV